MESLKNEDHVKLIWNYEPENFLKGSETIDYKNGYIQIKDGTVTAVIKLSEYEKNPFIKEELDKIVRTRFHAIMFATNQPFELKQILHVDKYFVDGKKGVEINLTAAVPTYSDITKVSNSKNDPTESIKKHEKLIKLNDKDNLSNKLIQYYHKALVDEDKFLVHLYNIRDALSNEFGNQSKAKKNLGISKSDWDKFGKLCNAEPLKQGRHIGIHHNTLRDATYIEYNEAFNLAKQMIDNYWLYLNLVTPKLN